MAQPVFSDQPLSSPIDEQSQGILTDFPQAGRRSAPILSQSVCRGCFENRCPWERIPMIGRLTWLPWMVCGCSMLAGNMLRAQEPVRPNASFTMLPAGVMPGQYPVQAPSDAGYHRHWGPTTSNIGAGPVPSTVGMAQPKYGWDAYPYPGKDGAREGRRQGCANPITCGNFWSDKTFIFGSCRQFFGHGRGCGGWRTQDGDRLQANTVTSEGTPGDYCPSCAISGSYWRR